MPEQRSTTRAQRLSLLFRAAGTTFSLPAISVLEVAAAPKPVEGTTAPLLHDNLPIEDLAELLDESPAHDGRSVTLVLDSAPPRALLVDLVEEVVDTAAGDFFQLPLRSATAAEGLVRGAVRHKGRLALELEPTILAELKQETLQRPRPKPLQEIADAGEPPDRALVFEVGGGRCFGASLSLVTSVLSPEALCKVPLAPFGHRGLVFHERSLLPIYDLSFMLGGPRTSGGLVVVLDVGGSAIGATASKVIGVGDGFAGDGSREIGGAGFRGKDGREVFFPQYEKWF